MERIGDEGQHVSLAIAHNTSFKEHQDLCSALEAFEVCMHKSPQIDRGYLHQCADKIKGIAQGYDQQRLSSVETEFLSEITAFQKHLHALRIEGVVDARVGDIKMHEAIKGKNDADKARFTALNDQMHGLLGRMREVASTVPGGEAGMMQRLGIIDLTGNRALSFPVDSIDDLGRLLTLQVAVQQTQCSVSLGFHASALSEENGGSERRKLNGLAKGLMLDTHESALCLLKGGYPLPAECYHTMMRFGGDEAYQASVQALKEAAVERYDTLFPELSREGATSMVRVNQTLAEMQEEARHPEKRDLEKQKRLHDSLDGDLAYLGGIEGPMAVGFTKNAALGRAVMLSTASSQKAYSNPHLSRPQIFAGAKAAYDHIQDALVPAFELGREHIDTVSDDSAVKSQIDQLLLNAACSYDMFSGLLCDGRHDLAQEVQLPFYVFDSLRSMSELLAKHDQLGLGDAIRLPTESKQQLVDALGLQGRVEEVMIETLARSVDDLMSELECRFPEGELTVLPAVPMGRDAAEQGAQRQAQQEAEERAQRAREALLAELEQEEQQAAGRSAAQERRIRQAAEARQRERRV